MWKKFGAAFGKMFELHGRASRSDFWSSFACFLIVFAVLEAVSGCTFALQAILKKEFMPGGIPLIYIEQIVVLAFMLISYFPLTSLAVRRAHDLNMSGYFLLVPVLSLILLCLPSSKKEEKVEAQEKSHTLGKIIILILFLACYTLVVIFAHNVFAGVYSQTEPHSPSDFEIVHDEDEKSPVSDASSAGELEADLSAVIPEAEDGDAGGDAVGANPYVESGAKKSSSNSGPGTSASSVSEENLLALGPVTIPITDTKKFNWVLDRTETLSGGREAVIYRNRQLLSLRSISDLNIYDTFECVHPIGRVTQGQDVKVLSLIKICRPSQNDAVDAIVLAIYYRKSTGYITCGRTSAWPYENELYVPMQQIQIGSKVWTVRHFDASYSLWENVDVRNAPGFKGTSVLKSLQPPKNSYMQVSVSAITEESDPDADNEPWVKIRADGVEGWIPGSTLSAERGGAKYLVPSQLVSDLFD